MIHNSCTIRRKMWMQKSRRTEDGRVVPISEPAIEVEVCDTPLITRDEQHTGVCGSCHEGSEHHERCGYNVFATDAERKRAKNRSIEFDNDDRCIMPGDHVTVYGLRTKETLLATVTQRYGCIYEDRSNIAYGDWGPIGKPEYRYYPDLVDVCFDDRPDEISKAHFTKYIGVVEYRH